MHREIERKYRVRRLPEALEDKPHRVLRQGYLAVTDEHIVVRIRAAGDARYLTIKHGRGLARVEVELPLTDGQFEALWPLTGTRRVVKTRYRIPVPGGTAELDLYHGTLDGLQTVEVEFNSVHAAKLFQPPDWFGTDITDDARYQNAQLALHGLPRSDVAP